MKYLQFRPGAGLLSQILGASWESALFKTMLINCVNVNKLTQKTQGGVVLRFQLADVFPSQQCPSPETGSAPRCGSWHQGRTRAWSMLGPEKAGKEGACKS